MFENVSMSGGADRALGMMQPVPGGDLERGGRPVSFHGVRPEIRRAPPKIGEHNDEIRGSTDTKGSDARP